MNNPYNILIILCVIVIASYIFNIISARLKIPSVILLLGSGMLLNQFGNFGEIMAGQEVLLELLGIIGLILIVLEGSLELKLKRDKLPIIYKSLISSVTVLFLTTLIISVIFYQFLELTMMKSLVYAVPLGVISSAIAIPSVQKLSPEKREFIIYESTFSDIAGIMLFNYLIQGDPFAISSVGNFFLGFLSIILISTLSSILLLFLLNYTSSHVKFFLVFAILMLLYSLSKLFHLPSLLLILIFGLMINNTSLYVKGKLANYLNTEKMRKVVLELHLITAEFAFIIRTFFFLLFGLSIQVSLLNDMNVVVIGLLIIASILLSRFILLRSISNKNLFPEIFIAPRGLITIVLFYSIPKEFRSESFNDGILFFVILASAVIMMLGLVFSKTSYSPEMEDTGS